MNTPLWITITILAFLAGMYLESWDAQHRPLPKESEMVMDSRINCYVDKKLDLVICVCNNEHPSGAKGE